MGPERQMGFEDELESEAAKMEREAIAARFKAEAIDEDFERLDGTGQRLHPDRIDEMNRLKDESAGHTRAADAKRSEADKFNQPETDGK